MPLFHNNISFTQHRFWFQLSPKFYELGCFRVCFYLFLYHIMLIRSSCYIIHTGRLPGWQAQRQTHTHTSFRSTSLLEAKVKINLASHGPTSNSYQFKRNGIQNRPFTKAQQQQQQHTIFFRLFFAYT